MKMNNKIYMPSDKGGEFTILTKEKYIELGDEHLSNTSVYKTLPRNNTETIRKNLNKHWTSIISEKSLPPSSNRLLTQRCSNQYFYHQLKTHKEGFNIRPIVSGSGGPFERIGWLLCKIISPLLSIVPAHLSNTMDLLTTLNNIPQPNRQNKIPISLDVKAMYTNIPINEAISTAVTYLEEHRTNLNGLTLDNVRVLLNFVLTHNIFEFNNKFYHQILGLAMGSKIAPFLAILVLDKLEKTSIYADTSLSIGYYKRYVDDIFILANDSSHAQAILEKANMCHETIKFELELPSESNTICLLDTKIQLQENGEIETSFFVKKAKKDIFIHANSAQPLQIKQHQIRISSSKENLLQRCPFS